MKAGPETSDVGISETPQHSLIFSALMHVIPGIAILLLYALAVPVVGNAGFHAEFAMYLSFLLVGIPVPLACLYYLGRKRNTTWSLAGILLYRDKIPRRRYLQVAILVFGFALYATVVSSLASPISSYLRETFFGDLPRWFLKPYSHRDVNPVNLAVMVTLVMRLVIDGIAHPIVEELYFRGYLLPRLSRFGAWCPVISALFFALFHVWQPYNIPVIFVTVLPWMYLVWWKRNVYLSILIHCLGNSVGAIFALVEFMSRD